MKTITQALRLVCVLVSALYVSLPAAAGVRIFPSPQQLARQANASAHYVADVTADLPLRPQHYAGDTAYVVSTGLFYVSDGLSWQPTALGGQAFDAFARLRTSSPYTLFESQSQYNTGAILWEDKLTATGTATHVTDSTVRLRVAANGDAVVRQSRQYLRYRPGKSQIIAMTFQSGSSDDGDVTRRIGYFDGSNGIYYQQVGSTLSICQRDAGADTCVAQSSWNVDPLTGGGNSGVTLSPTKSQILLIDLQWLGVGRVRVAFDIDGVAYTAHEFLNANTTTGTYMVTANLPVRYEISATGAVSTTHDLFAICATVQSEGGFETELGYTRGAGSATGIGVTTRRAVMSIRPKATFNSITNRSQIIFESAEQTATTNGAYCELVYNPTLGGVPSWTSAGTNSVVEYDVAGTTVTGGDVLAGWFVLAGAGSAKGAGTKSLAERSPLTLDQAGANPTILTIACTAFTGTSTLTTAMNWREFW